MKKILLVDDSRALRTLVSRHLREQGWEVIEADDGLEGVMLAMQHRPDLVLLDVAMPHLDGTGALLKIRSKQLTRNIPVVMMTAASDRETVMKLARLGIQDYIVKPFTIDLMLSKVYKLFARQAEEGADGRPVSMIEPEEEGELETPREVAPPTTSLPGVRQTQGGQGLHERPSEPQKSLPGGRQTQGGQVIHERPSEPQRSFPGVRHTLTGIGKTIPGPRSSSLGHAVEAMPEAHERHGQPEHPERPGLLLVRLAERFVEATKSQFQDRFNFFIVEDIESALALVTQHPPQAVVMDLKSPGIDAVQGYKRLKYLPALLQTPFIILRHTDPGIQEQGERMGMQNFLPPDPSPSELIMQFEALDKERLGGRFGATYIQMHHGIPFVRWPESIKLEKLRDTTWEIEDNLKRMHELGQHRVVISIGAIRQFNDAHLLLLLAVMRKAAALSMKAAVATQNQNALTFFQQYEDTRNMTFYATIEDAWTAIAGQ